MNSDISIKTDETMSKARVEPYLIVVENSVVLVDKAQCGMVVGGEDVGKSYGDNDLMWDEYPLYEGVVTLSNDGGAS